MSGVNNHPGIIPAHTAITTNAAANTQQSNSLVAAPGAGFRIRLFGWSLAPKPNNTGAIRTIFREITTTNVVGADGINASIGSNFWSAQGIPLSENNGLESRNDSNVASQPYNCTVYYATEKV